MRKLNRLNILNLISLAFLLTFSSCKKDSTSPDSSTASASAIAAATVTPTSLATLGLVQYGSGTNKRIFIPITKVGTQTISYYSIFDTGSSGMTIDADGLLPASMITTNGVVFTGDSIVVNGITVTNKQSIMAYGDNLSSTKVYGNVAYAPVTMGDSRGSITGKRIPIFIYYKVVASDGTTYPKHAVDVFGVGPGFSYASNLILSPLSYFTMPANVTNGFKLAALSSTSFNSSGTYVSNLLTIGLTPSDLTSEGFIMHPLSYSTSGGYSANIPATITYGSTSVSATVLFDTGTPSVATIENRNASALGNLAVGTAITITTTKGFKYSYTTASKTNLTQVQNPNNTGDYRSIFALDFFVDNLYLTDYANHQIGLRNK